MSKKKKIVLIVLGLITSVFLVVVGLGAKMYLDLSRAIDRTYESVEHQTLRKKQINLKEQKPYSTLLLGIDTGDLGRLEQGRSDTMIVAAVNPQRKSTALVSLARDTYVELVGQGTEDKINHAYAFGGAKMAMETVQNYLTIPIDHYVSINMAGLKDLINAIGGIDVNNHMTFSLDGYDFTIGKTHLTGEAALAYSRMRYEDPKGDYGRQERQRKIIEGIVNKLASLEGVSQYQTLLQTLEANLKTDLSFEQIKAIALNYREAFTKIEQDQLQGTGFMKDDISYQKVDETELKRVQNQLKKQLNLTAQINE